MFRKLVNIAAGVVFAILISPRALAQCPPDIAPPSSNSVASILAGTLVQLRAQIQGTENAVRNQLRGIQAEQCAAERNAPPEQLPRGPQRVTPFAVVPILFITDRQLISIQKAGHKYFGPERQTSAVSYGRIVVRMPAEFYTPRSPVPTGIVIESETNSQSGVSVAQPLVLTADQFTQSIRAYKAGLPRGATVRVLLFIHGFNVTFPESLEATARLAFGLKMNVLPVAISWPSQGDIFKYFNDEENIEASIERFRPVVQSLLANPDVDEVIVIAHSMGCRLITRILSQLSLENAHLPKLKRVVLAAADLNEAEIRELWPRIQPLPSKGWLFYTSGNDYALRMSAAIHSVSPIGDSKTRVFEVPQADTVDASAIAPSLRGYGHSYVIDNPLLRADLRQWISTGLPASQRTLTKGNRPPGLFWELTK